MDIITTVFLLIGIVCIILPFVVPVDIRQADSPKEKRILFITICGVALLLGGAILLMEEYSREPITERLIREMNAGEELQEVVGGDFKPLDMPR